MMAVVVVVVEVMVVVVEVVVVKVVVVVVVYEPTLLLGLMCLMLPRQLWSAINIILTPPIDGVAAKTETQT